MRKIKFRAWDKNRNRFLGNGEMLLGNIVAWNNHKEFSVGYTGDYEVMQFTGLLDKNGKEIYENDIVKSENGIEEICWNQLHCSWGLFKNGCQGKDMLADWINSDGSTPKNWECKELEVIGNIYEHSHLLNIN